MTLDEGNLLWLRGRARATADGNLSEALDRLVTTARTGGRQRPVRSAVGLVTIPEDDPDLTKAKATIRALFEESPSRPIFARETDVPYGSRPARPIKRRKTTHRE